MNWMMEARTYAELPSRQDLTGLPLPNQPYRDPGQPGVIFQWVCHRRGDAPGIDWALGEWWAFTHVEPEP